MQKNKLLTWRENPLLRRKERFFWLTIIVLGVAAIIMMRYLTPYGMGLVNDSVGYIGGARNILAGNGYSRTVGDGSTAPITHFPPFFSIVLAAVSFFGFDTIQASRLIVLLLFGANTIFIAVIIRKLTNNWIAGIVGAVFFLLSEPFLRVHSFALSEPLYLFLTLLVLALLIQYKEQKHWAFLAGAGLVTSLAFLTRYVGASLYLVAFLMISYGSKSWLRWIRQGVIFSLTSLPLVAGWVVRNITVSGNATNRPLQWHPIEQDVIQEGLIHFFGWLLPETGGYLESFYPFWVAVSLLLLLGLGAALFFILKAQAKLENNRSTENIPAAILIVHALSYLFIVIGSMSFFDDSTRFEHRILAPFTISILILLVWGGNWLWKRGNKIIRILIIFFSVGLAVFVIEDTLDTVKYLRSQGQGFANGRWTNSELVQVLKTLPEDKTIFSNRITVTYLLADRPTFIIPWLYNPVSGLEEPSYQESIDKDRKMVLEGEALILIFDYDYHVEAGDIPIIDLTRDLPVYQACSDGVIFGMRDDGEE